MIKNTTCISLSNNGSYILGLAMYYLPIVCVAVCLKLCNISMKYKYLFNFYDRNLLKRHFAYERRHTVLEILKSQRLFACLLSFTSQRSPSGRFSLFDTCKFTRLLESFNWGPGNVYFHLSVPNLWKTSVHSLFVIWGRSFKREYGRDLTEIPNKFRTGQLASSQKTHFPISAGTNLYELLQTKQYIGRHENLK